MTAPAKPAFNVQHSDTPLPFPATKPLQPAAMSDAAAAVPAAAPAPTKKAPKATKPKGEKKSGHSYVAVVQEAIVALHERSGSSLQAIKKYVESKGHAKTLGAGWEKRLSLAVRAMAKSGSLVKVGG